MASAVPSPSGEETFQSRLNLNEPFTQPQLLALIVALAEQLRDAHRAGRYHGAITPADIRFDRSGEPSLGGWGRDTTPNAMQSSAYAPIECYAPVHPQGPWTDVYALAAILWRAITGGPPASVLHRKGDVTLERMAPTGYEPAFLRAVDAALAVAPQRRPRDIDAWLAMLANRRDPRPEPVAAPVTTAPAAVSAVGPDEAPPARRSRLPLAALGAGVIAAVAGGIYIATPASRPANPTPVTAAPAAAPRPAAPVTAEPITPEAEPVEIAPDDAIIEAEPPVAVPAAPPVATVETPRRVAPPRVEAARPAPATTPVPAPLRTAPVVADPPLALIARADDQLRLLYADYEKLNRRIGRSYRDSDVSYPVKQQAYRESRRIQRELVELRDERNRIARSERFDSANRRYEQLVEKVTRLRDRIEMVRRTL